MAIKKYFLFILLFIFSVLTANAQWDSNISQYWAMKNFYNPSFVGQSNALESSMIHRRQWVGIKNAPVTSVVSVNMPLKLFGKEHGVGVLVNNDKLGLFSNTSFMVQYAYKFIFKGGKVLNVGLQGGMFNVDFDASGIIIPNSGGAFDASEIPSGGGDKVVDGGLGVSWVTPNYYLGASVSHLWNPSFSLDDNYDSYIARTFYLVGGYNIKLGTPLLELQPSVFYKTDAIFHQVDLTARLNYKRFLNGGVSWRKDDGFIFLLGFKIRNIEASYSYDLSTSEIGRVSKGTHEIFIKYSVPLSKAKKRGALKSIRIL